MCLCVYMHTCKWLPIYDRRLSQSHWSWSYWDCELPDVGADHQALVLHKSSKYSLPLSSLSAPCLLPVYQVPIDG